MDGSGTQLSRRRVVVALALAVCLIAGVIVYAAQRGAPDPGSLPVRSVAAYQVTYRVEDHTSKPERLMTERVAVDRPLRSRRVITVGAPPGTGAVTGSVTTETGVYSLSRDGGAQLIAVAGPGEVGADLWLAAALAAAERRDLVRRSGTSMVIGRRCTWWVSAEPLDAAPFAPSTSTSRTRSCVDQAGLLLADEWHLRDTLARRRTAVDVVESANLSGELVFDGLPTAALDPQLVMTHVTTLTALPQPSNGLRIDAPLDLPIVAAARIVDVDPQQAPAQPRRETVRAVYDDGVAVVVVDQVRDLTGTAPDLGSGAPIALGVLGTGRVRATSGGLVLTAITPSGDLLRVRTNVLEDEIVGWLRSRAVAKASP